MLSINHRMILLVGAYGLLSEVWKLFTYNVNYLLSSCFLIVFRSRQAFLSMASQTSILSSTLNCNVHIVHSPNYALLLNLEKFKIYFKRHINIAATCFGLRPSSGSLYRAWLKLYICFNRNMTLARLYTSSLMMMIEDRNM